MSRVMNPEVAGARPVSAPRERAAAAAASRVVPVRRSVLPQVLFAAALFVTCLFYVWSRAQVINATYELSRLQKQQSALEVQNEKLRLEIATLKAPAALGKTATEQLKMVPPRPDQLIMVR